MQPFDGKNQEEFDAVTERINEALLAIAGDETIKATATEIARLANIHRNTVNNREWPLDRLKAIKEDRRLNKAKNKTKQPDKESLSDKLTKANLEILYWFNKSTEYKELYDTKQEDWVMMRKARDSYRSRLEIINTKLEAQSQENKRLIDLLNTVGKE